MSDSFGARSTLRVGDRDYQMFRVDCLEAEFGVSLLPYSVKILLENLLRHEGSPLVTAEDVAALAGWRGGAEREIAFRPARVLMQDFTGVPAVVDLAAMRDAMESLGGSRLDPLLPVDLVIDHSVTVDVFGTRDAFSRNVEVEYGRNEERYRLLRWAQQAFANLRVVTGSPIPTRSSGPTPTLRWSTASAWLGGESAASRRRLRSSVSLCPSSLPR
jgi:aconitate hydratase